MKAKAQEPNEFLDKKYTAMTDMVVPYTISPIYSFTSGVAIIASLSNIATQFLAYFSLSYLLALAAPIAIGTGVIFAYVQYLDDSNKIRDLQILRTEIENIRQENLLHEQRLCYYFKKNKSDEEIQGKKTRLSLDAGEVICARAYYKDKRNFASRFFDFIVHFVKDAGFSFGACTFIITTFTTIPFVGMPLSCVVFGSLIMAALTYALFHRRRFEYDLNYEAHKQELEQQKKIARLYRRWFKGHPQAEKETAEIKPVEKHDSQWYDVDKLHQGYLKNMLDEIYTAINIYLVHTKLIPIEEITAEEKAAHKYSIAHGRLTEIKDCLFDKANNKVGRFSKNIMMAMKIALMIEHFYHNPESYRTLVYTINQMRFTARSYSPWSLFRHGKSKLADALDDIFDRTSAQACLYIETAPKLKDEQTEKFKEFLDEQFDSHENLQAYSHLIPVVKC